MKPLLKNYVSVAPVKEGVYFAAGQRNFVLKGNGIYPLVSKLLSSFDSRHTVSSIESALPEKVRPFLATLLDELTRNKMVQLIDETIQPELAPALCAVYQETIAYLQDETPDFAEYFLDWREAPILVAGAGHSFEALAAALAKSGLRRLRLCLDPASASERPAALVRKLEEHAVRDEELEVTWLSRAQFEAAAHAPGARIAYANDAIPDGDEASLFHWIVHHGRADSLLGGIHRGRGVVGPQLGAVRDNSAWDRLPAGEAAIPLAPVTRAILGALMGFELLKSELIGVGNQAHRHWLERHLFHIDAGAQITTHPVGRAAAPKPAPRAPEPAAPSHDEWSVSERRHLETMLAAAFDPLTGVMAWDDTDQAVFPLARRGIALRLRHGGEPAEHLLVSSWGATPQQVGLRALCQAAGAYAEWQARRAGARPVPLCAAPDHAAWRGAALANAIAASGLFARHSQSARVALTGIDDPGFQMLARLARLYAGDFPTLSIQYVPGLPSFLASASLGGTQISMVAETPVAALVESLGAVISALQGGAGAPSHPSLWRWPAVTGLAADSAPRACGDLASAPKRLADFALRAVEQRIQDGVFADAGLVLGSIALLPCEAQA